MVKVNTLGKHDGRLAFWVDGKLTGDFPNFYLRSIEELKANLITISFFTQNPRVKGGCFMWYDDVVAATSYIGPMIEEKKPAAMAPLPEGDTGIASKYPGDVGIERDPAVVFHDDFEDCAKPADLHKKYEMVIHEANMRIADEPANVGHGKRALECAIPQQREDLATGVHKHIKDERDVLFLRYYSKYEKDFDQHGSCHSGGTISAHYQLGYTATPGVPSDGLNKFLANFETERGNFPSPGPLEYLLLLPRAVRPLWRPHLSLRPHRAACRRSRTPSARSSFPGPTSFRNWTVGTVTSSWCRRTRRANAMDASPAGSTGR